MESLSSSKVSSSLMPLNEGSGKFNKRSAKPEGMKFGIAIVFKFDGISGIYQVACFLASSLKM